MADINGLSMDSAVEKVMALLGDDDGATPAAETPIESLPDEAKAERIAQKLEAEEAEPAPQPEDGKQEAEPESQTPAIEPPAFWDADAKERFKSLPPADQQFLAERERERESVFGKTQREAADAKKAAEAQLQAATKEREAYTQNISQIINMAQTMDPVIAEGRKTDWAKLAQEDPVGAFQKRAIYDQRMQQLNALQQEKDRVVALQTNEQLKRANDALSKDLDFWGDAPKREKFQGEMRTHLKSCGFEDTEISGITDHRAILIARDAMLYRQLMAQQEKIPLQKKPPSAPKQVLKSQASVDSGEKDGRVAKALQRVKSTGRLQEQAAALASILD